MIEIVEFIFSDFWRWLGAFLMLIVIVGGLSQFRVFTFYENKKQ